MGRTPWYILAYLLLALIAHVQSERSTETHLFEILDEPQPGEKANDGLTFESEDNEDETNIDNLADGNDSDDVDDSLEDEDFPVSLIKEKLLSDLLPLLGEMTGLNRDSLVSELLEMVPRHHHRRHKRHHKKHKKSRHKEHKKHEHHEHEHVECTSSGENEYTCNSVVSGEEVSVTVVYDASTEEFTITMMANEQQEIQGSAPLGTPICGENSSCIEIEDSGDEKCVKLTSPEEMIIGCFTVQ